MEEAAELYDIKIDDETEPDELAQQISHQIHVRQEK